MIYILIGADKSLNNMVMYKYRISNVNGDSYEKRYFDKIPERVELNMIILWICLSAKSLFFTIKIF